MKDQIENLKQELREFLELLKTITQGKWMQSDGGDMVYRQPMQVRQAAAIIIHGRNSGVTREQDERDATFIARSRNISPALAECLLVAVEGLEAFAIHSCQEPERGAAQYDIHKIITIWEASK